MLLDEEEGRDNVVVGVCCWVEDAAGLGVVVVVVVSLFLLLLLVGALPEEAVAVKDFLLAEVAVAAAGFAADGFLEKKENKFF